MPAAPPQYLKYDTDPVFNQMVANKQVEYKNQQPSVMNRRGLNVNQSPSKNKKAASTLQGQLATYQSIKAKNPNDPNLKRMLQILRENGYTGE